MDKTALLESIRKRSSRTGIVTADRYFREVEGCFDGGTCPLSSLGGGAEEQWRKSLSDAESKLTYSNSEMVVVKKSFHKSAGDGILQFDAIVTTPRRDRDGDVLETKGARLDKNCPLLWQHMHMQPIGKLVRTVKLTDAELVVRLAVANTVLGRDAVELIKMGAVRISHGFEPIEYEAMDDEEGWRFKHFSIYEISVVSVPSNTDAIITSINEKSFKSDIVRGWQKSHGGKIVIPDHACTCHKSIVETEIAEVIAEINKPMEVETVVTVITKALTPEPDEESVTCPKCKSTNTEHVASENGNMHCQDCGAYFTHDDDMSEDMDEEKSVRSFEVIERDYLAALVSADNIETLRRAHGRLSTMLVSAEDQLEASEWDDTLSSLLN